jgi:hypothetical protein
MDDKTKAFLEGREATSFLTEENKAKLEELNQAVKSFEREFQIKQKESWDSAAKVVLNS